VGSEKICENALKGIEGRARVKDAKVQAIDGDGDIIHVEMKNENGEQIVGVYQLIGWTKPSKKVKAQAELELYVPPKLSHPIQ
jgi:hypothetical protein|tara:strand:- start:459 stop:707 length:249 start_codon:yes stop_codon:yes gene_type:complete